MRPLPLFLCRRCGGRYMPGRLGGAIDSGRYSASCALLLLLDATEPRREEEEPLTLGAAKDWPRDGCSSSTQPSGLSVRLAARGEVCGLTEEEV